MPDPVTHLLAAARQRAQRAAQTVVTLEAEIGRLTKIPSPAEESLIRKFQELLTARVAEHNEARRDLAELEAQPRWRLEQLVTARQMPARRAVG